MKPASSSFLIQCKSQRIQSRRFGEFNRRNLIGVRDRAGRRIGTDLQTANNRVEAASQFGLVGHSIAVCNSAASAANATFGRGKQTSACSTDFR